MGRFSRFKVMLLLGYLATIPNMEAFAQGPVRPEWADPTYIPLHSGSMYYSIQYSPLSSDTKAALYNKALAVIAGQIQTLVESTMMLNEIQEGRHQNPVLRMKYENLIKSTASAQVYGEDLRKEEYYDPANNMYWLFVYLYESDYKNRLQARIQASVSNAVAGFESARRAENDGKYVLAANNYYAALRTVREFVGSRDLSFFTEGNEFLIDVAASDKLRQLLGSIYIEPPKPVETLKASAVKEVTFSVWHQNGNIKTPVTSLPVRFAVKQGEADIDSTAVTDTQGNVSCRIHRAKWDMAGIRINAWPDWSGQLSDRELLNLVNLKLDAPRRATAQAYLASPVIQKDLTYKALSPEMRYGKLPAEQIVMSAIIQHLATSVNAKVTEDEQHADMQIKLDVGAASFANPARANWRTCEVNCSVRLVDPKTSNILFSPETITTRGAGLDDMQALNSALDNAKRALDAGIMTEIERLLIR